MVGLASDPRICYIETMLLEIENGTLSIGGHTVLSHFHFEIRGNEKIALVGRNGCGKTTFLRLLAGELSLDGDDKHPEAAVRTSRKLTVGLLSQQAVSDPSRTVEEELLSACPCADKWDRERFAWEQEYDRVLTGFGLRKEDKKRPLSRFSGGEQTKIAFIRLLLSRPDILLLDEPTNHLDMVSVEWLEDYLRSYPYAAVIVSHDRYFLDRTADTVCEIQNGTITRYAGNYTDFRAQKQKNLANQQKAYLRQQEEQKRLEELIERFKHKPRKAAFARSRRKILERMPRIDKPSADDAHIFTGEISPAVTGPKYVLEAEHLQLGYEKTLLELSLRVRRGQRIGIIGPNGAGKSTFLKTVAGLLPPVKGKCALGQNVTLGYFDQQSAALASEQTVIEHFHRLFPGLTEKEARGALGAFLFSGKKAAAKVSQLSGGERARLVLAELFQSRPNLFLLDEPTNHMDIPAKETLESAFLAYTGTILFVSHDRYFIRRVAQSLLIFEENSVLYYPFGYDHYIEHCRKAAAAASQSARVRAEEQALIAGLQNVPKAERHETRELSDDRAYEDWQLHLALEPLESAASLYERHLSAYDPFRGWTDASYERDFQERSKTLCQDYTRLCLEWYEKWAEFHPETPSEMIPCMEQGADGAADSHGEHDPRKPLL